MAPFVFDSTVRRMKLKNLYAKRDEQKKKELLVVVKKFEILQKNHGVFLQRKRLKLRKGICCTCRKQAG